MKTLKKTSTAVLLVCGGVLNSQASPLVQAVYDVSAVDWSQTADWQNAGPEYTNLGNSFSMALAGGLSFDVFTDDGRLERRNQGSSWLGDFGTNDPLLRKARGSAPIEITFSSPICAFGTQVQNDVWGGYSVWATAYDVDNNVLANAFTTGNAGWTTDGSAPFIGFSSHHQIISRIVVGVNEDNNHFSALEFNEPMEFLQSFQDFQEQAPSSSFAINGLMLMPNEGSAPVPVPEVNPLFAGAAFSAFGFAGLWLRRRKD